MKTLAVALALLSASCVPLVGAQNAATREKQATFYVSPLGRDSWSGSLAAPSADGADGPLATVTRARDAVRSLGPGAGATILLRGGTYRITQPLVFAKEDSGTEAGPRVYESYPGETAVISGTRVIDGPWRQIERNLYAAEIGARATGSFRTLLVDGQRATWARYPNQGFLYAKGGQGKTVIELAPGTAKPAWSSDPNATVNIVAERGWYNEIVRIAGVGEAGQSIEITGREAQGRILAGNRFFVEGVRAELDSEGEWYFDHQAGTLYFYSSRPPTGRRFEIATVDKLIELRGRVGDPVRHLAFRGLGLVGSDFTVDHVAVRTNQDAAIQLVNAHNIEISGCRFENIGGYAVWLHLDSRGNVIRGNEIADGGGGGVLLTSARFSYQSDLDVFDPTPEAQQVAPVGNVIAENHIHHGGAVRLYCSGVHLDSRPLSLSAAQGNYVGFNHIHDMSRNGIFVFRNQGGNIFEANHIHDVIQRTNDGGAIHLASMNPLCAPTHIVGNRIYRVGYQGGKTNVDLSFGIYPDWFTSRMVIRGNVVSDTRDGGIRLLGGDDAVIEDNLVGDDVAGSVIFGRWSTKSVRGIVLRGNRIVNGKGPWVRYYTEKGGAATEAAAAHPSDYWSSTENTYWGRENGGGILVAKGARGSIQPGDRAFTLPDFQKNGGERSSTVRDFGADGVIDISADPEAFGHGSETFLRMKNPRSAADAKRWLQTLDGEAAFVDFDDPRGVSYTGDWKPAPTKITDFLAFADLKQMVSREGGGKISFTTDVKPGKYAVFVKWYGNGAERAPLIDIEVTAPGANVQRISVDHWQESHKWLQITTVESRGRGKAVVTLRNPGGGMVAINSVAWTKLSTP